VATIDSIMRRVAEVKAAERQALVDLAVYLRETAIGLPDESKLAYHFARAANALVGVAGESTPELGGRFWLGYLVDEAEEDR